MAYDCGVYVITNRVNGHRYVGSASSFNKRFREHRRQLSEGRHHSRYLQRAWNLYGEGAFTFQPILYCSRSDLIWFEQRAMDGMKPEYNIAPVAGSQLGYRHTEETRRKMSAARRRNPSSPRKGMRHTDESKLKISQSRKGKGGGDWTQQRRDRISASLKGRTVTTEQRNKISRTLRGHKQSAETIAKRVEKLRGRKMPEGFAEAQSQRMLGKKMSAESREKLARARSRLTDDTVRKVWSLLRDGASQRSVSEKLSVSRPTVADISCGRKYKWVI